jgi:uncharacterized protein (TIGR03083 family)
MLVKPQPILVANLFPKIHTELIALLRSLSAGDWQKATACADWSVKDVALHLLGGEIGNLSRRRDGNIYSEKINSWDDLVAFINEWNQSWVSVANRISPRLLVDLLDFVGSQMCEYFQGLNPYAMGGPVSWVGPEPAPGWMDVAREYTERWHHQQHIRDAVEKPGLKQPEFFSPVLEAFMWALPRTYRETTAEENASVTISIVGQAGGRWSIVREEEKWNLYIGSPDEPSAEVIIDQETAWRLFTRGMSKHLAGEQVKIKGDQLLGARVLDMVSIIG